MVRDITMVLFTGFVHVCSQLYEESDGLESSHRHREVTWSQLFVVQPIQIRT